MAGVVGAVAKGDDSVVVGLLEVDDQLLKVFEVVLLAEGGWGGEVLGLGEDLVSKVFEAVGVEGRVRVSSSVGRLLGEESCHTGGDETLHREVDGLLSWLIVSGATFLVFTFHTSQPLNTTGPIVLQMRDKPPIILHHIHRHNIIPVLGLCISGHSAHNDQLVPSFQGQGFHFDTV